MTNNYDFVQNKWLGRGEWVDPMRPAYPWLHEEKTPDGTRLVRRCSEIDGGCGESEEVLLTTDGGKSKSGYSGLVAWYRKHTQCGVAKDNS